MRDFDANPYSVDEERVVKFLDEFLRDIGAGDDPIGFLLASYRYHLEENHDRVQRQKEYWEHHPVDDLIPVQCKQDVVDLLFMVQAGAMSCRRASDLLFPQFMHGISNGQG